MTDFPLHLANRRSFARRGGGALIVLMLIVCIAVGLVAVAWGLGKFDSKEGAGGAAGAAAKGDATWHTVSRRSFDIIVSATGELDARNKVYIKNEVEGKTSIIDIVDEGVRVAKDDVLVRLADDQLKESIRDTQELVQKAAAEKTATEQDLAIEKSEAESLKRAEEVKLSLAKLELDKWREGTVKQKERELEVALVEAQDNLKIAERNAIESKKLLDAKFISEGEYDDDQLKWKKAIAAEQTAALAIKVYQAYTLPQEREKFTSDVTEAEAALDRVIRKNASKIARAKATFDAAVSTLATREEKLAKLNQQLAACTLRAPSEGVVVYATSIGSNRYRRSEPIGKNRDVLFSENLIVLPDTTQMVAILKVNESRLPDIELGQKVVVSIDAMRGRTIEGTVSQKASMADETSYWNPDVRTYEVRVELPPDAGAPAARTTSLTSGAGTSGQPGEARPVPPTGDRPAKGKGKGGGKRSDEGAENGSGRTAGAIALNPGMRCTGQIFIERIEDVIAVPVHGVFTEKRDRFCYVPSQSGLVKKQLVQVGRANELYVEIRKGLNEGDLILLHRPDSGEIEPEKSSPEKAKEEVKPGK